MILNTVRYFVISLCRCTNVHVPIQTDIYRQLAVQDTMENLNVESYTCTESGRLTYFKRQCTKQKDVPQQIDVPRQSYGTYMKFTKTNRCTKTYKCTKTDKCTKSDRCTKTGRCA
jgi:hypothetical protein